MVYYRSSAAEEKLEHRFKESMAIPGTRKYHWFAPLNKEEMMVYPISSGTGEKKRTRKSHVTTEHVPISENLRSARPGDYISCIYDSVVWYGIVEKYCEQFDDYTVNFLHPIIIHKTKIVVQCQTIILYQSWVALSCKEVPG